ncbi:MAG: trigger factor [Deltaproteobacteria bacterium]|nr:trigger factor [Deltaproteobacteria bacterium]
MTNILVEDLTAVRKKVTFEIPQEKVSELIDAEFRDLKKTVQIKGFRKGKVPITILRAYFKSQVEDEAKKKLIEETFQPGLDEKKINLVSVVKLEPEAIAADTPFKYTAEIEVTPPIEVKGYKGLSLTKYKREVTEEQVAERLERLRERQARLTPVPEGRGVTSGDYLVADIKVEVDGEQIPALTVTDYHLELGREFYLNGFDAKIEGMKPGESDEVSFDLPEDFPRKELAGKSGRFHVTLKEAKERILPAVDDEFARDLGKYESMEELKAEIRQDIASSLEERTKKELEKQIVEAVVAAHEFEVPETMVESQINTMLDDTRRGLARLGINPDRIPPPTQEHRDEARPIALRDVKAALILKEIADKEGITVSDEDLDEGIRQRAERIGASFDYFKDMLENQDMLPSLRSGLLQEKVLAMIQEHATITEQEAPADEEIEAEKAEEE